MSIPILSGENPTRIRSRPRIRVKTTHSDRFLPAFWAYFEWGCKVNGTTLAGQEVNRSAEEDCVACPEAEGHAAQIFHGPHFTN